MITGFKIFKYEAKVLERMTRKDGSKYKPVQDINGDWFIFKGEHEECGLGVFAEFILPEREPDPKEII